jgi:hypothetical protein
MLRKTLIVGTIIVFTIPVASAANTDRSQTNLRASEIANRNVAARGGLEAWRAVQTLSWTGKLGAGGNQRTTLPVPISASGKNAARMPSDPRPKEEVQLPFMMEMQRPRRARFELKFKGQTAVQVFDGTNGWKLRPYLNRLEVEPFTELEMKAASMQADLDGPLIDYGAKGTRIELVGMEKVEDRDTYNLKLTMNDGHTMHVWIDAQTFLEAKIEGRPRRLDGMEHAVEVYYRDYREVSGLQIPFVLETKVLPVDKVSQVARGAHFPVEMILIEKVVVNPKLDASLFTKPHIETAMNRR